MVFLSEQRRGTDFVETVAGRAANTGNSLHNASTRLKIVRNSFHGKEVSAPSHRCACTGARAFFAESVPCIKQVFLSTDACAGMYFTEVF